MTDPLSSKQYLEWRKHDDKWSLVLVYPDGNTWGIMGADEPLEVRRPDETNDAQTLRRLSDAVYKLSVAMGEPTVWAPPGGSLGEAVILLAAERLQVPRRESQPPVDNAHVAEGCEQFSGSAGDKP